MKHLLPNEFKQGVHAFRTGKLTHNFYKNSMKAKEWQRGWNHAYFANKKRLELNEHRKT